MDTCKSTADTKLFRKVVEKLTVLICCLMQHCTVPRGFARHSRCQRQFWRWMVSVVPNSIVNCTQSAIYNWIIFPFMPQIYATSAISTKVKYYLGIVNRFLQNFAEGRMYMSWKIHQNGNILLSSLMCAKDIAGLKCTYEKMGRKKYKSRRQSWITLFEPTHTMPLFP